MDEFQLIAQYFTRPSPRAVLGVGDDCALLQTRPGVQLAISSDMLVAGRHFFPNADPHDLGHKALAVNLSDLAACGAEPLAFTLALALPQADPSWLAPFSQGLLALADAHDCNLIGGDTTRGPLNICITVFGEVPPAQALLRSAARPGDDIYVSGTLGEAALALHFLQGHLPAGLPPWSEDQVTLARQRLDRPTPRVALGLALRGIAHAAADVSDGLVGDLGHILARSGLGATIDTRALPAPPWLAGAPLISPWLDYLLAGGDDYELVFTAAPSRHAEVLQAAARSQTPVTRIGQIEAQHGLRLLDHQGGLLNRHFAAFDHFANPPGTAHAHAHADDHASLAQAPVRP